MCIIIIENNLFVIEYNVQCVYLLLLHNLYNFRYILLQLILLLLITMGEFFSFMFHFSQRPFLYCLHSQECDTISPVLILEWSLSGSKASVRDDG